MNKKQIEEFLGKKIDMSKDFRLQVTESEWTKILFWSEADIKIAVEKGMVNRTLSDKDIEKKVLAEFKQILEDCDGDYEQALLKVTPQI